MFKNAWRNLSAALLMAAVTAAPSSASARALVDHGVPALNARDTGAAVAPTGGVQTAPSGFDWADAGVGAVATLVVLGAGTGAVVARRRQGHRAVTS